MNQTSISIGIPVFNEEATIANLIESILVQKIPSSIFIKEIIIYNDASTDKTEKIIDEYSAKYKIIKHIKNKERKGVTHGINSLFRLSSSNIWVGFAGDTLLKEDSIEKISQPFLDDPKTGMVGGNPVPISNVVNFTTMATKFSAELLRQLRIDRKRNLVIGRLMALRGTLIQSLQIPSNTISEEPFLLNECFKAGLNFHYADNAIIYYAADKSLKDYLIRNQRSFEGVKRIIDSANITNKSITQDTKIDFYLIKILIRLLLKHPLNGICWITAKFIEKVFTPKQNISHIWKRSKSDKINTN